MTFTGATADEILQLLRAEGTLIKLHVGPAGDGTTNPAKETRRQPVTFRSPANKTMVSGPTEWPDVAATETYTHFSVWSRTGVALGAGELEPVAVNAGDTFTLDSVTWTLT